MKAIHKIMLAAAIVAVLGAAIFTVSMTLNGWDFSKLSTVRFTTVEKEISEDFRNISIDADTADVLFVPSDDGKCRVSCYDGENIVYTVCVDGDSLVIQKTDDREWYEYIAIAIGSPKVTVYLPKKEYGSLTVNISTGDVEIHDDFTAESIDISATTGDIRAEKVTAGSLSVSVSTGGVTVKDVNCGAARISVSTGSTELTDVSCESFVSHGRTGDVLLKNVIASETIRIERSTGDVTMTDSDAAEIFVETTTGDVMGTLLSEKVFIVETSTGSVTVPRSAGGGRCEITTSTGDIFFK